MVILVTYIDAAFRQKCNSSLRVSRLVFGQELKLVVLILEISNIAVSAKQSASDFFQVMLRSATRTHPLPARYRQLVPSSQNGMHTPEIESRLLKPPMGLSLPGSHSAS